MASSAIHLAKARACKAKEKVRAGPPLRLAEVPSSLSPPSDLPKVDTTIPPQKRVLQAAASWASLGDTYISRVVTEGLKLDWVEGFDPLNPVRSFSPRWEYPQDNQPEAVKDIIAKWLKGGIITVIPPHHVKSCSSIFAIPKKESQEWRLITNLKNLNEFIETTYFRLPTLKDIAPFIKPGMWGTKVDIKGAYNHWPIHPRDKPYLVFYYDGVYYQHETLPFGLNIAPREWQRAMTPLIKKLRGEGILIWVYLDDFIILGVEPSVVKAHTLKLLGWLALLGLEVNWEKSEITPVQELIYLGFVLDLAQAIISVPKKRLGDTLQALIHCTKKVHMPKRHLASLLGKLRCLLFAMPQLRLFSNHLSNILRVDAAVGWDQGITLTPLALDQVEECIQLLKSWKGRCLLVPTQQHHIFTDASQEAWGATLHLKGGGVYGEFQDPMMEAHINIKEAEGALQGILAHNFQDTHLLLFTDSTNVFYSLKRWGSKSVPLNQVIKRIWEVCQAKRIHLTPHWIPSSSNPADQPSRKGISPFYHSSLHPEMMQRLLAMFSNPRSGLVDSPFCPKVDWMATLENSQCSLFVGEKENFFCQKLERLTPGWFNPPWALIPQALNYWASQSPQAQALVCLPYHPNSPWWVLVMKMRASKAVLISQSQGLVLSETGEVLPKPRQQLWVGVLQGIQQIQQHLLASQVPLPQDWLTPDPPLIRDPKVPVFPHWQTFSERPSCSREPPLKKQRFF